MDKQGLSSIIKSARDIMRKDAGLSTDVDRIPQLSWILFLKAFDDLERERTLLNEDYREAIEKPYRWRDWAAEEEKGLTGDDLVNFVNNELFPYLRGLIGVDDKDQRTVIAEVFQEIYNSMRSGYLLRDIIDSVNKIDFTSSDDIHTMAHLYESMLKEMRDAAGSNGEFYTPRPVIRFIVHQIKPKVGETVLDPALGTGGFLTESFEYMKNQQKKAEDREILQYHTLYGIEKKPMPYLLGMMNLLLHGIERPNIKRDNSLRKPLIEITEKDKVDIIMTNPPFGGEEERGILDNFPEATRTSETALLFLQYVMRKLKNGGKCGIIVPDRPLFSNDRAGVTIKKELINNFNLHTIVRLPKGVFSPYTDIETNLLFFNKEGTTKEVWYYEHPLPPERQKLKNPCYTKTKPLRYYEFKDLIEWWENREVNEYAWKVSVNEIINNNYDLDIDNPNTLREEYPQNPRKIVERIIEEEKTEFETLANHTRNSIFRATLNKIFADLEKKDFQRGKLKDVCEIIMGQSPPSIFYNEEGEGLPFFQGKADFGEIYPTSRKWCTQPQKIAKPKDILISVRAPVGPTNICKCECCVGRGLAALRPDPNVLSHWFLLYFLRYLEPKIAKKGKGSTFRAITKKHLMSIEIPLPSLEEQERIVLSISRVREIIGPLKILQRMIEKNFGNLTFSVLEKILGDLM